MYDQFDRTTMDGALRRAFCVDDRLPPEFTELLTRLSQKDRDSRGPAEPKEA